MLALLAQNTTTTTTTTTTVDVPAGFYVLQGLGFLIGLVWLICFILVVVKMFQNGQSGLGIVTLITTFCCGGIGFLIAFVVGWMNANTWGIKNVMLAWTVSILLYIGLIVVGFVAFHDAMQDTINQMKKMQGASGT